MLAKDIHHPPHADAVAEVALSPLADHRDGFASGRALLRIVGHRRVEMEDLDIGANPESDLSAVRPPPARPLRNRREFERAVLAWVHRHLAPSRRPEVVP